MANTSSRTISVLSEHQATLMTSKAMPSILYKFLLHLPLLVKEGYISYLETLKHEVFMCLSFIFFDVDVDFLCLHDLSHLMSSFYLSGFMKIIMRKRSCVLLFTVKMCYGNNAGTMKTTNFLFQ